MAVKHVETFSFDLALACVDMPEHPDDAVVTVTMGRAQLDQLWDEIGVALGHGRRGAAIAAWDEQQQLDRMVGNEEAVFTEPHPGVQRVSVEEAAAQAQIAAKMAEMAAAGGHTANPHQPRGSAIGNRHTEG